MSRPLIYIFGYSVGSGLLIYLALKYLYYFYDKLKTYHKIPTDYDPYILTEDDHSHQCDPSDFASPNDIYLSRWRSPEGSVYKSENEVVNEGLSPEIEVDLPNEEVIYKGERPVEKFLQLWYYTSVAVLATVTIIIFSLSIGEIGESVNPLNLSLIIGIIFLVSLFHTLMRLAAFVNPINGFINNSEELKEKIYDFGYGFFMSLFLVGVTVIYITLISSDNSFSIDFGISQSFFSLLSVVIIVGLVSFIGEIILRVRGTRNNTEEFSTTRELSE